MCPGAPMHHVHVRRHHRPRVALLVVEERVRADVRVPLGASREVPPQDCGDVHHAPRVDVRLSHGLAVGAGVLHGGGWNGAEHRQVLLDGVRGSSEAPRG